MVRSSLVRTAVALVAAAACVACPLVCSGQRKPLPPDPLVTTLKTTVRRVIVDVVVTDSSGKPVSGLTRQDFSIFENNAPQTVLSFEPSGFGADMDYVPEKMAALPTNTFVNLPKSPEKGPLYVLLYDLIDTRNDDQMFARQQLVTFIKQKPEGTRFAVFVFSDGLHLMQGFTSEKALLFQALDPQHSRAHLPKVFLMGRNFGQGDTGTALWALNYLASYLDGLPGRKNVIWLSGAFPVSLFSADPDSETLGDEVKKTLDLFARSQIAIYPVDARGVIADVSGASNPASAYLEEDEIARITGGRAFYSTNDVKAALAEATEDGTSYYALSYAPSDRTEDNKIRKIRVELGKEGYTLAYRRTYYALDPDASTTPHAHGGTSASVPPAEVPRRKVGDSLDASMEHGAPMAHALVFGVHMRAAGAPAMGTPQQMTLLADEPGFFRTRRRNAPIKPLAPILLQRYLIDYTVMARQLQAAGNHAPPNLEIAVAAYDSDGVMLNANVNTATPADGAASIERQSYRAEQEIFVPPNAATIRMAVRDANTDRIGAMEVDLPLKPETHTAAVAPMK